MTTPDIVSLQTNPTSPQPSALADATNLLLPPTSITDRIAHFPEGVYNLSQQSHLVRFLNVLLGDAGAGQARKRMLLSRLQQTMSGSHFYNLDRFYGALFGVKRSPSELLALDPYSDTATADVWTQEHAKDASYRSRITQFARAITYGATPTGMELVAEALLTVDCEIYESYLQADGSYQTNGEIENNYATYGAMEGVAYSDLEGAALGRLAGDNRREFVVRPKRAITESEAYDLTQVLTRLKPADARFSINTEPPDSLLSVQIRSGNSDSNFWEILQQVHSTPDQIVSTTNTTIPDLIVVEPPRPPFTTYQGEEWTHIGDVIGVLAYINNPAVTMVSERVDYPNGISLEYEARAGLLSLTEYWAGRSVREGVLVTNPCWFQGHHNYPDLAPIYFNRLNSWARLKGQYGYEVARTMYDGGTWGWDGYGYGYGYGSWDWGWGGYGAYNYGRFWVTPYRWGYDTQNTEIIEIRLSEPRLVNHITFDASHYPHDIAIEVYDDASATWINVSHQSIQDCVPRFLPWYEEEFFEELFERFRWYRHPFHDFPDHWQPFDLKVTPVTTQRIRFKLTRNGNPGPFRRGLEVAYSLALRNINVGYQVTIREDVPPGYGHGHQLGVVIQPPPITTTTTTAVSIAPTISYSLREQTASDFIAGLSNTWRCDPQPVNFAVVNFYLDIRDALGMPQVVDRFFIDPTHTGVHMSIYWTANPGNPTDSSWYDQVVWTPIPRDYSLQKGYVHIPPTNACHFKFEFTALTPEPFETLAPVFRKVRLFPADVVASTVGVGGTSLAAEAIPSGVQATIDIASTDLRYRDAITTLSQTAGTTDGYVATTALYPTDPASAAQARQQSWVYGFQPWHQGGPAPRFPIQEVHTYNEMELRHTTKVGFFVGLNEIQAFRLNAGADDDSQIYTEHFHDFSQIVPGFTWTFNPNQMTTGTSTNAVATSRVYGSLHNVKGLQFATQQSLPIQLVYDDDFRDPAKATSTWTDPNDWHSVGDAVLTYSLPDNSVVVQRSLTAVTSGIESGPLPVSPRGRAYAAVRVTLLSALTSPLLLQVVDNSSNLLVSMPITGTQGETLERVLPYDLAGLPGVRVRLVQNTNTADLWKIDTFSLFDEGIVWDFSVDGGNTWVQAIGVRNNSNAIITFPNPGNQLVWRVTGQRAGMAVTSLQLRPQYVGVQNARYLGTERGPNVSVYDSAPPIQDDPEFTDWTKPIPRSWFSAYRNLPKLASAGVPDVTEFARFYGRPITDTVVTPTDAVVQLTVHVRTGVERMDYFQPVSDAASQHIVRVRALAETAPAVDVATGYKPQTYPVTATDSVTTPADSARIFVVKYARSMVTRPIHPVLDRHPLGGG